MKKWIGFFLFLLVLPLAHPLYGDDFLGVPLVAGDVINKTGTRLKMTTLMTHDQVLQFYKSAFKETKEIKVRDWKESTHLEDHGASRWHSITISKYSDGGRTHILIVKDNWTWIIEMLSLLFLSVMAVLLILFLVMNLAGKIIPALVKEAGAKKAEAKV